MFKQYRQQGCQFECRVKKSAEMAGCVPWDYPLPTNFNKDSWSICRNMIRHIYLATQINFY